MTYRSIAHLTFGKKKNHAKDARPRKKRDVIYLSLAMVSRKCGKLQKQTLSDWRIKMNDESRLPEIVLAFVAGLLINSPAELIWPATLIVFCVFLWWLARL